MRTKSINSNSNSDNQIQLKGMSNDTVTLRLGKYRICLFPHGSGKVQGLVAVGKLANSNADMAPHFGE